MKFIFIFLLLICFPLCLQAFSIVGNPPPQHHLLKRIQQLSNEEKQIHAPEYSALLQNLQNRLNSSIEPLKDILHDELSAEEALEFFGPYLECHEPDLQSLCARHFSPEFYFYRGEKSKTLPFHYFSPAELEEIYQVAMKIMEMIGSEDILVSLGQSPAYVIEALEELGPDFQIFKIPFSGAPDFCLNNFHYKKYLLSNITSPKSLQFYRETLEHKGFSPSLLDKNKTIFIVDLVGSGGSLASFIKIMIDWYKSMNIPLPEIKLLDISVENRNFRSLGQITLPISDTCYFLIDRLFIHTSAHLSDTLDYTEGEDRIQPPFGALQWKSEYMPVFNEYPNEYAKQVINRVKQHARKHQ